MFDDLLASSIEEDEDEMINDDFSNVSIAPKTTTPRSLEQVYRDLLENLDDENCEIINSSDVPATSTDEVVPNSNLNPIILSFVIYENHIGAAYYNAETWELFIMDDIYDTTFNISIIKTLYKQCLPKQMITVKGISQSIVQQIQETITRNSPVGNSHSINSIESSILSAADKTELKILPKNEFPAMDCCTRVKILKLENEPPDMDMSKRILYLNSLINFKSTSMIYALGLLLNYIDKNWNIIDLNIGQPKYLCINHILLKDVVMLNEEAYDALDILRTMQHPSFFRFGNTTGQTSINSLFALFNQCQSKPGSQRLWQMLHYPSKDINLIKIRLAVIEFFMQPNNQFIADNLKSCLKRISNISPAMLKKNTALNCRPLEWKKFFETLYHIILIEDICKKYQQHLQVFENLVKTVTEEMHFIKYFIEYIIDFDESKRQNKLNVKRGVDDTLDELFNLRERLPEILTKAGSAENDNLPPEVESYRMLYFPDICFVLCITKWKKEIPEDAELPNMEYKFTINNLRHYKTSKARELDNTIGDVQMKIDKRESQIITRLAGYISQHVNSVLNALRQCVDLDVLLSFYTVAINNNYVKPNIVAEQVIAIKESRHPLYELSSTNYVANDIYSGNGRSVFKILTGPNACGKSVYLKQIALIVYMAHLGSYVPAESATIGIVDYILTQISFNESSVFDASVFIQDLRQMNTIIHSATRNSLVIIDEFGKSTSEIDGLTIASSVMTDLINRKAQCPHVFASTHMHKILSLIPRSDMVEMLTFEYIINADNTIVFLYRLIIGSVSSSYAHTVVKLCGVREDFLEESLQVYDKIKCNQVPTILNEETEEKRYMIRNFICSLRDSQTPDLEYIKNTLKSIESISKRKDGRAK